MLTRNAKRGDLVWNRQGKRQAYRVIGNPLAIGGCLGKMCILLPVDEWLLEVASSHKVKTDHFATDVTQQPLRGYTGGFSLATRGCRKVVNWSLGLCDWGLSYQLEWPASWQVIGQNFQQASPFPDLWLLTIVGRYLVLVWFKCL